MTTTTLPVNIQGPPLKKVSTLSGQTIEVMGDGERAFYRDQQTKYTNENGFTASADLQDLDRLLFFELINYRYTTWLSRGRNYHGEILSPSEAAEARRVLKENASLISSVKSDLGLTKAQREREQYESVGAYLVELKTRAKEHGVNREKQLGKALCLINELFAMVGAFDRADEIEREKLGLETPDEILDWIRTVMRPEYDAIDAYFRGHHQKMWVRNI